MRHLVFLLEEPSARDLLEHVVPRIVPAPDVSASYLVFEGKSDLEKGMTTKMRAWRRPNSGFVVLRDQDAGDCRKVRQKLFDLAEASQQALFTVRVACRELESWILGDWTAVARAFDKPALEAQSRKATYKNPDLLSNPVEELRKHIPTYQKRDGARRVGAHLDLARNCSPSFRAFCTGVQKLVNAIGTTAS
ncbi:MAG: DUF4276 family protein [Myxococcales bacterium]|nr:DUF4276 family protein [Myxococcales bacterium]